MSKPCFSVVIPTCDRPNLLAATVSACLLSPYENLEVLVSDNFSTPETAKVVERFRADPRVRYVRTSRRLSMPDHWEFAWQQSRGEYIIINSDDDACSPTLVDRLEQVASGFNAALMSWDAGLYYHPDWNLSGRNTFVFTNSHSRLLFEIDPQAVFASYARLDIPVCFPQGTRICFSREIANRALSKTGRLFWPPYPDYSAPLLLLGLLQNQRYVYLDALLGYGGRSLQSNAASLEKDAGKVGNQERVRQFYDEFDQDIYPHHELKLRSLWNGHAETFNLLRHILPDVFARYCIDPTALIAALECEFQGIGIHNSFLGPQERAAFDAFTRKQDPAIVKQAMEIVKQRKLGNRIETFRAGRVRGSWHVLGALLNPGLLKWIVVNAITYLGMRITRPRPAASAAVAGNDTLQLVAKHRDSTTWLDCSSFGGKNGLDVVRRLDEIVAVCDRRDAGNIAELFSKGFLVAAHEVNHLSGKGDPAKVAPSTRS